MNSYLKLTIASLLPVALAVLFYELDHKTKFSALKNPVKQCIYGICFGGLAIVGTEWGIPMHGAQVNCRDGAVLIAGLIFGAPAGIIAGLIGGIERWFAVAWGVGTFTRVACTVSTIIAGFYAAVLRKYMFDDRRPSPAISVAIGVVTEIFHLTMVILTNYSRQDEAMDVVAVATFPMLIANGLAVAVAAFLIYIVSGEMEANKKKEARKITPNIQWWLFIIVVIAFFITEGFMFRFQTGNATSHANAIMGLALRETANDIKEEHDPQRVYDITWNRHISETGYVLVYDQDKVQISAPYNTAKVMNIPYRTTGIAEHKEAEPYRQAVDGADSLCQYKNYGNYQILAVYPTSEAFRGRNTGMIANSFVLILVLAVVFGAIDMLTKKAVVNPIAEVNKSLAQITNGNLNEVVNVRSSEEFATLSDDINETIDTLKEYIDEASKRIDKELEFAKNIQLSALPTIFPAFPKRKELDIYASTCPAKEVGGDFYDFYFTREKRLNFLIADVSGKGIPAAMFMMRAKTELKGLTEQGAPLSEVFMEGNKALCEGNDAGMFVTAWQGSIDLETGHMTYVNAGHNPPLVRHGDGSFEYLKGRACFVLAGMDGVKYREQELDLKPGDIVFLYTDGVTEATNAQNELYGEERLLELVNRTDTSRMDEFCKAVKEDVDRFYEGAPQFDDITVLAFKYNGDVSRNMTVEDAKISDITGVIEFIETSLTELGADMKTIMQMDVAADEILANIISYAYPGGSGPLSVRVYATNEGKTMCLRFMDEGIPYNPLHHEDPDVTLSAEERGIGGLGIYMVKKTMDEVKYEYLDGKNVLKLKKNLK